jgi:hypothetical protein
MRASDFGLFRNLVACSYRIQDRSAHLEAMESHHGAVEACPGAMEAQPGAMETHHRTMEVILGHVKAQPVALEEPGGMESHHRSIKAYSVSLRFTLDALRRLTQEPRKLTPWNCEGSPENVEALAP